MLTQDQKLQFREDGFLLFEELISGDRLARYVAVFDELVERGRKLQEPEPHFSLELETDGSPIPGLLHKVQGVCVVEPRILGLASEPAILDRVGALLAGGLGTLGADAYSSDTTIDIFGTKFFPKLPGGGTSTHWHQDNYYFGTTSERIISCGCYLEPADTDNGCLRVVPGSHRGGGIVEHRQEQGMHGSWTEVDEAAAVDIIVPGGSVVLFSANLLHGTNDNRSDRSRYSTAWHYVPGDLALDRFPRAGYEDRHTVLGV